jgi:thiol-disulfide isomerase/thioredoxin
VDYRLEREKRPVLVDVWATWCKNCLTMDKTTFEDPDVVAALSGYVKIKFQAEDPDAPTARALMTRLDAIGLPAYACCARMARNRRRRSIPTHRLEEHRDALEPFVEGPNTRFEQQPCDRVDKDRLAGQDQRRHHRPAGHSGAGARASSRDASVRVLLVGRPRRGFRSAGDWRHAFLLRVTPGTGTSRERAIAVDRSNRRTSGAE